MQQERAEGGQELRVGCGSDSHRVRARLRRALARCWVRHVDPDHGPCQHPNAAYRRRDGHGKRRRTNTGQWAVGRDWRVLWRLPHMNGTQCPGLRGGMGLCGGSGARGDASRNTQVLLVCACHLMVMHTVARNVLVCGLVEVEVGGEELCELVL